MEMLTQIIIHTPVYVWGLLAYLIIAGIKGRETQTVTVWRMLFVPVIFIAAGFLNFDRGSDQFGSFLIAWFVGLLVLAPVGYLTGPRIIAVDRENKRIESAGTTLPLIRNLIFFCAQYVLAVLDAFYPQEQSTLMLITAAVSGASAGYFGGWLISLWFKYQEAHSLNWDKA
ncbi:hypothetical protein J3U99_13910 [Brucella pituitosa]|uniref:DUF6622 family protein n=1 Tax=Brucella pituitosa TaxID=571256 RepID=UPI000C276DB1|nr:DUF6622 family protein [Brucella pituitosa]MCK4205867.1 hypothetical protein [Brucella pituitosa]PJO45958.1 hypothetical protein CWE02_12205 [Brucella pituitosa]PRA88694.1 hypothetical protein CQ054_00685 [Ochrobactrum sp. MYb29]